MHHPRTLFILLSPILTLLVFAPALAQPPHIWSMQVGQSAENRLLASAVDQSGNFILTGHFNGTVDFGDGQVLICEEDLDIFVVKYATSGTCLWARRFGGAGRQIAYGIAVDTGDNIFLAGTYQDELDFGTGPLPVPPDDDSGAFLAKLDPSGTGVWGADFLCDQTLVPEDVVCDGAQYVYMTGRHQGTVDFGGGPLSTSSLDVFLAKFSAVNAAHQWSRSFTGSNLDYGEHLALDGSGNILLAGHFADTIDLGGGPLTSQGWRDVFLARFDPSGSHLWSLSFGGPFADEPTDLVVDTADKPILVGTFRDTVDFGGGPIVCDGYRDGFVVQFDDTGAHRWSRRLGGASSDDCQGAGVNGGGEITLTGKFGDVIDLGGGPHVAPSGGTAIYQAKLNRNGVYMWSTAYGDTSSTTVELLDVGPGGAAYMAGAFGVSITLGGAPLKAIGYYDHFVAKHDDSGNHLWSRAMASRCFDTVLRLAAPSGGGILHAGTFMGHLDSGPLQSAGLEDIYLAKCDDDGAPLWDLGFGNTGTDLLGSMADDGTGRILLTGSFEHSIDFGGGPLTATTTSDGFLAKFTGTGVHMWSRSFGATQVGFGAAVAGDGTGDIYLAGDFAGQMDLGGGVLTSTEEWDIFLAKFDHAGNHLWSRSFGILGVDHVKQLSVTPLGGVVLAGTFTGQIDLGRGPHVSSGGQDVFMARFGATGRPLWSLAFGDTGEDGLEGLTVDASGGILVTGGFEGTIDPGGGPFTSGGGSDIYLAKFSEAGVHLWSTSYGSPLDDGGISLAMDAGGTFLWTGFASGDVDLGGGMLPGEGREDVLLAKFSNGGAHLWSSRHGNNWDDRPAHAIADAGGNVLLAGFYTTGTYIGDTWLSSTTGDRNGFLAKFGWDPTGIGEPGPIAGILLHPASPNPCRTAATALLEVPLEIPVRAGVFDVRGRRVRDLLDRPLAPGVHAVVWDGRDARGARLPAGVYFLRAEWPGGVTSQKLVLSP